MTRDLCTKEGIFAGGSCGASVLGAIRYAKTLSTPKRILVILHDTGFKYASKIYSDSWMKSHQFLPERTYDQVDQKIMKMIEGKAKLI